MDPALAGAGWLKRYAKMNTVDVLKVWHFYEHQIEKNNMMRRNTLVTWYSEIVTRVGFIPQVVNGVWDSFSVVEIRNTNIGAGGLLAISKNVRGIEERVKQKRAVIRSLFPTSISKVWEFYFSHLLPYSKKAWTQRYADEFPFPLPQRESDIKLHVGNEKTWNGFILFAIFFATVQLRTQGRKCNEDKNFYPWWTVERKTHEMDAYFFFFILWFVETKRSKSGNAFSFLPNWQKLPQCTAQVKGMDNRKLTDTLFNALNSKCETFDRFWNIAIAYQSEKDYFKKVFGIDQSVIFSQPIADGS